MQINFKASPTITDAFPLTIVEDNSNVNISKIALIKLNLSIIPR